MNRIKQILGEDKFKKSVNKDLMLKIALPHSNKILPTNEINTIIDVGVQFNKERQKSTFYRVMGSLTLIASNALFNINGLNSWEYLNNELFKFNGIKTLEDSIKNNLSEIDGWFGFFNPIKGTDSTKYIHMEPKKERFLFNRDIQNKTMNWDLTLTYPYASDGEHPMVKDGLLIVDKKDVNIGGKSMIALATPVLHNLSVGNKIKLKGVVASGEYEVIRLGLDNGDLKDYYFCIQAETSRVIINNETRMVKMVSGNESIYYFRKFKKIKTKNSPFIQNDDYEITSAAFSESIYSDKVAQFCFNEDIDVSGLQDNLGRPLSEIYFTRLKTQSNDFFTSLSSGIETPFIPNLTSGIGYLNEIPVIQRIHNGITLPFKSHTPLEQDVNINSDDFYGDLVEYNTYEVKESVLAEVYYRFNTKDRETNANAIINGPRHEGYYYKAHDLLKIRNFSSYVEQGSKSTVGMPDYKVDLGDGRYLWRDLLDIGINETKNDAVDYPFLNGCHYLFLRCLLLLKRQDPFDNWGIYFSGFPADPIGNTIVDNFKINLPSDEC